MARYRGLLAVVGFVVVLRQPAGAAPLRFERSNYATGICPASVVGADLDEDGRVDLLVANHHSYDVSIYLGTGSRALDVRPPAAGHEGEESHGHARSCGTRASRR